jgi:predicted DNA-binding protein
MLSSRISVRIPERLTARLRARSRARGTSESNLVREALEEFLQHSEKSGSAFDLAEEAGIIGTVDGAADLSTNRRYFKGFGKKK